MTPAAAPPSTDPLVAMADRCVQCGLCLPACPTYGRERLEAESPRGRIAIARAWTLGTIAPTPVGDAHLDHCLGCRSCEAVCPAGVQYGELLSLTRARQRTRRKPAWRRHLLETLAARPRLLAALLLLYRTAFRPLPKRWRLLPQPPGKPQRHGATAQPATGPARRIEAAPTASNAATGASPTPATATTTTTTTTTTALFHGCLGLAYEAPLRDAITTLCAALDIPITEGLGQTCCGALHAHAGDTATAATLAARNRTAFSHCGQVLSLASGCHEALARSVGEGTRVRDAAELLAEHADRLHWRRHPERVALHLPCTQRNVVKSVPSLRRLLARVPGLEVVELTAGYGCCGAAGSHMLTEPERADAYRQPLLAQLSASGATRLLSANLGCRLHLANGTPLPVEHPLEFLARLLDRASS